MATGVGLRSERGPLLLAVMVGNALVALDTTIVASAVPSIVASVGDYAHFPWVFSIYLLTQAITVPVYGKLADEYGRKPVILVGIALFLAGSLACGSSWNMTSLIVSRGIQGLGGGAVQPIATTIAGDLYSVRERAKIQAHIALSWALAAVFGSATGGVIAEAVGWRTIFFFNVVPCLACATIFARRYHEPRPRRATRFDLAGAVLLPVSCALFMVVLLQDDAWSAATSRIGLVLVGGGVVASIALVVVERRVDKPILPLWIVRDRLLLVSGLLAAALGGLLVGVISYVPVYARDGLGAGSAAAGLTLAMFMIGWPLAAAVSGRVYTRLGFRTCESVGAVIGLFGTALFAMMGAHTSLATLGLACFVTGFGLGLITSPLMVAAQSSVAWDRRGAVTASNMFFRAMGSAVTGAVFGAILVATLHSGLGGAGVHSAAPAVVVTAMHRVFVALLLLAVVTAVGVAALPADRRWRTPGADSVTEVGGDFAGEPVGGI